MMNIALVGVGAVGAVYARLLHDNPDVQLYCMMDAVRKTRAVEEGIYVNGERVPLTFATPKEVDVPIDVIIFTVKNPQMQAAVTFVEPLVGEDTALLSLLNGIDSEAVIAAQYGESRVLYGLANGIDALKKENKISYTHPGILYFGERDNRALSPRVERLAHVFSESNIPHAVPENMEYQLWHKFMVNAGVNPVTAIMRATHGALRDSMDLLHVTKSAMREIVLVAQAAGIPLAVEEIDTFFTDVWTQVGADGKTSMLQDIEAGRTTENEYFGKRAAELGKKYNVATPVNDMLYHLVRAMEHPTD
ncbi:ketopantoate reductase family protein [Geomicrobium sp. JCM 19039]|uniref:ketopantoate reductase family protein n=1 Tax=Geomicrobium sp. JCM 19039 TaxID=1460636 RepID=UPI00045F2471|nr:ketopantoate reductase family protein [Geomicrobium sp. JCM 19039]GAK14662.1 2-dehydropantoate 2-reductase [Geomicrobium sp. JCM 19039]